MNHVLKAIPVGLLLAATFQQDYRIIFPHDGPFRTTAGSSVIQSSTATNGVAAAPSVVGLELPEDSQLLVVNADPGHNRADYAQTMTVATPVIPYSGISVLFGPKPKR
jgi:hypothetical protein